MSTNLRHALVAAVMISLGFLSGCGQEITAATSCKDSWKRPRVPATTQSTASPPT